MSFPIRRLRRMRSTEKIRGLVKETSLLPNDLICPVIVQEGIETKVTVDSMPDVTRVPIEDVIKEVDSITGLGIPAIMLFGVPAKKDEGASASFDENGIVQRSISKIKAKYESNMVIMADVCLCQYTSSGHCGILKSDKIDNDSSIATLAQIAVSQARAGVDVVSPSAMMDGQVSAIRTALDDNGFSNVSIMSHSAKHRSNFYSPFRDAALCKPQFGDRKTYQVPYTNAREAIREVEEDVKEGVDIVMIKPALAYLDLISEARKKFNVPISAYSVSGEYALVKAAANNGWIPEEEIIHEILYSIKRAGADMIVTYFAKSAAKILQDMK